MLKTRTFSNIVPCKAQNEKEMESRSLTLSECVFRSHKVSATTTTNNFGLNYFQISWIINKWKMSRSWMVHFQNHIALCKSLVQTFLDRTYSKLYLNASNSSEYVTVHICIVGDGCLASCRMTFKAWTKFKCQGSDILFGGNSVCKQDCL